MHMPEEWELIDFFGPSEYKSKPEDGLHYYELATENNLRVSFALNIFLRSVHVKFRLSNEEIVSIYQEGVTSISIQGRPTGNALIVCFDAVDRSRSLIFRLKPNPFVSWEEMIE